MANKKETSAEETVTPPETEETTEAKPSAEEATPGKSGSVTVFDKNGQPFRTYSKDIHGPKFADLAKEFISDRPGFTIR